MAKGVGQHSQSETRTTGPAWPQGHRAYEAVKRDLLQGRYKPSEALPIDTIAASLAVSRQPVMDAMRRLAAERLIDIIPQVGCRVASHSPAEIGDFFQVFAAVEALVAQLAAERRSEREVGQLRLISAEIGELRAPGMTHAARSEGHRTLNREFHGLLHEMARTPEIVSLSSSYWDRSDFYLTSSSSLRLFADRLEDAHDEHEALLSAVAQKRGDIASTTMREHILSFRGQLLDALTVKQVDPESRGKQRRSAA